MFGKVTKVSQYQKDFNFNNTFNVLIRNIPDNVTDAEILNSLKLEYISSTEVKRFKNQVVY